MEHFMKKLIYIAIVIITLVVFVFYFVACSNDITAHYDTISAKSIILTGDDGEVMAKVKAEKDATGKTVVKIISIDGTVMGTFQGK